MYTHLWIGFTAKEALEDILADYEYDIAVNEAREKRAMKRLEIEQNKVLRLKEELRQRRQKKHQRRQRYGYSYN